MKKLFLILTHEAYLSSGELGNIPNQFYFAESPEQAFKDWYAAQPKEETVLSLEDEEAEVAERTSVIEINSEAGIIAVYRFNTNMEDWDDIDQTEVIHG